MLILPLSWDANYFLPSLTMNSMMSRRTRSSFYYDIVGSGFCLFSLSGTILSWLMIPLTPRTDAPHLIRTYHQFRGFPRIPFSLCDNDSLKILLTHVNLFSLRNRRRCDNKMLKFVWLLFEKCKWAKFESFAWFASEDFFLLFFLRVYFFVSSSQSRNHMNRLNKTLIVLI